MDPVSASAQQPPAVFRLAAHTLRWRLLNELARSDHRVRELTGALAEPQPLVSYHLRQLRAAGLVSMRRSSFDARDTYYSLDLRRCGELLRDGAAALHPALRQAPATRAAPRRRGRTPRVLFLCTGNSARSQIAEALLDDLSGGAVLAFSAGSHPKELRPNAVRALRARGLDVTDRRSKHLDTFRRRRFDWVISLCDRVREVCPEFPGEPRMIHWSIPDPAAEHGSDDETYPAFERTAAELEMRIHYLLATIDAHTTEEVSRP